jgi:hypothetical protein
VKIVLFDLGNTLEFQNSLLHGAFETLSALQEMHNLGGSPVLALVSDFLSPDRPEDVKPLQMQYYKILKDLGIHHFFEPLYERVTLSTEVGVKKPDEKIFRTAVNWINKDLPFRHVIFITEKHDHIIAARALGMKTIHFQGPDQTSGEVSRLVDLIPLIRLFVSEV